MKLHCECSSFSSDHGANQCENIGKIKHFLRERKVLLFSLLLFLMQEKNGFSITSEKTMVFNPTGLWSQLRLTMPGTFEKAWKVTDWY